MANLKNITDLPVAESAEGLNLIVNDNGSAKQIAASAVGAQADWAEMDETSPAFIKNKPVEEWDLDFTCNITFNTEIGDFDEPVFTINTGTFKGVKNKILNEVPKIKVVMSGQIPVGTFTQSSECYAMYAYMPDDEVPEAIGISFYAVSDGRYMNVMLLPDNTIVLR